ncbi:hypothetical protein F5880DRAFT_1494027, partial [Lentinula raphanica]
MAQPANRATSSSNTSSLNTLSSIPYESNLTSLSTLAPNPSSPKSDQQPTVSHSHTTVLERAQEASSSVHQTQPNVLESPSISNLAQSLSQLIDLDEDRIIENSVDSLIAEGIGENDLDTDEDENDPDRDESETDSNSPAGPTLDAASSQKNSPRRPYPTWFQDHLTSALNEIRADRDGMYGQSRIYRSGTFWFPIQSTWSLLQKQNVQPTDLFSPQFFLWDPDALIHGIACPNCKQSLHRNQLLERPRRIIDIDSSFWIIGYTYRCRNSSCNKVYRSWDRRILCNLPPPLAAEFPAHLSWRSGLSLRALRVLRSCIQSGMGAHQVAAMFRVQHLLRYDELRRQYLQTVVSNLHMPGQVYKPFLPFENTSDLGFHGFVPSGQWLRDIYDGFIESHKQDFHQHTAMLSCEVGAIDHSFKVAKHIAQVNGEPIFTALLTVTNAKGEIRVCDFVTTKSHSQFTDALVQMRESLKLYGHQQPKVFYTDNIADKGMLEECFPSLLNDVVPIEKHSDLPLLTVPSKIIHVLATTEQIDNALRAVMERLPSSGGYIAVGFDAEWNVDFSEDGRVRGRGPTAVIQIALENEVYVLQIGQQLALQKLPQQLLLFLRESRIIKAGHMVNGDLRHLQTISNQAERISSNWDDAELSPSQIEYAARDAYASFLLFQHINGIPLPRPVTAETVLGTPLVILSDDQKKIIAYGDLSSSDDTSSLHGINITSSRTVVHITEVLIPGAVLKLHNKALAAFGPTPFKIVSLLSRLRIDSNPCSRSRSSSSQQLPTNHLPLNPTLSPSTNEDDFGTNEQTEDPDEALGTLMGSSESATSSSAVVEGLEKDAESVEMGKENLGPRQLNSDAFANVIRSRVLKDPFHVFNMIYISRTHALRIPFAQTLRDAIFIPHPEDKRRVTDWLHSKGLTWDFMLQHKPRWLWLHVRRTIPPPEVLYPIVHEVFMKYGPLKDSKTHLPLFSSSTWKTIKNILDLIRNGYLSDPPGLSLYSCIGLDYRAGGLRIW